MKLENKILTFDEGDIKVLNRLKIMVAAEKKIRKLKEEHSLNKEAAYAEIKIFLAEKNIDWTVLEFDDTNNLIKLVDIAPSKNGLDDLFRNLFQ